MITLCILGFVGALLVNWFVLSVGKDAVSALQGAVPLGKYLSQLNKVLVENLGEGGANVVKIGALLLVVLFVIFNLVGSILFVVALAVGTLAAKRGFKVPAVQNVILKVATYINRLRS